MTATLKLLTLLICINTFMYLGVRTGLSDPHTETRNSWVTNDLFDVLLTDTSAMDRSIVAWEINGSNLSYSLAMSGNLTNVPSQQVGSEISAEGGGLSFLDGLRVAWAFCVTLIKIGAAPIILFTSQGIPPVFALIVGIPLTVAWLFCIMSLFRGGGAP